MKRGVELKPQWPSTLNVLSSKTALKITEVICQNPLVAVSEKLDGSNLCVSSKGWVGTRKVILIQDLKTEEIEKIKFNRSSLTSLKELGPKVEKLHQDLSSQLECETFQTLIYGEWLQARTSRSQQDLFNYKGRGFKNNYFYAFGLGLYFDEQVPSDAIKEIENKIKDKLEWSTAETDKENKLLLAIFGNRLKTFMNKHEIETAPLLCECSLDSALTNKALIDELLNRKIEGFILTSQDLILKWKFVENNSNRASQIEALEVLKTKIEDPLLQEVISALEKVGLDQSSAEPEQPRKRPEKHLYARLLRSAETKFPKLEDQYENSSSIAEHQLIYNKVKKRLENEIQQDLELLGYSLEDSYLGEVETFVARILTSRTVNWNRKKERLKPT